MARLYVIPARDEPVAVILRRGPSKWYHVILWETRNDHFTHGAWLKGRIYEEKCDLSPDGKLFVYFVHQGGRVNTEFTDSWTAVSRPPWLHALVLWPHGTTYGGGGQFTAPRRVFVNTMGNTHPDFPVRGLTIEKNLPARQTTDSLIPDADWSGYDHRGNTIYTRGDVLYRLKKRNESLLADFSSLEPDPQPAPAWAKRPL